MPQIKFSHKYNKFPQGFAKSRLIEVIPVNLEDLSTDFRIYDTQYTEGPVTSWYPLPLKGKYMILMLYSEGGHLWTTIRSQRGMKGVDKLAYYRSHIGEVFDCVVTQEPSK